MKIISKISPISKLPKSILILPIFFIFTFLNGCLNYYQEVRLYPDGSGKMHIDYWMKFESEESEKVAENLNIFNTDSIKSEFQSPYTNVEDVIIHRDSTDSTTHALIDISFTHIDSLNKTKVFSEARFSFEEKVNGQVVFSQLVPPIITGFGFDASNFKIIYKYIVSGEILEHNANSISGKTLTWDYRLSDIGSGQTISFTFRPYKLKETPDWIYYLSGAVLLLVLFFLLKRRKN